MTINKDIKFKYMTKQELFINLDRLSRFKLPEYTYERVFSSIILKNLLYPKFSKKDTENLPGEEMSFYVKKIWNASVKELYGTKKDNGSEYNILKIIIKETFKNIPDKTKKLINTELLISDILYDADENKMPFNLKFLLEAGKAAKKGNLNIEDLKLLRKRTGLKYPAEKLVIAEGITEEILLPVFAKKLGRNFDEEGTFIAGAGGKSKSPDLYSLIKDKIKIPVILLFDKDAKEITDTLENYIESKDKIILLTEGEFEDILSLNLIKRTLNNTYEPATPLTVEELKKEKRMCKSIENFFRTRHLGEYKKSAVSKLLAENIKYAGDISEKTKELFDKI